MKDESPFFKSEYKFGRERSPFLKGASPSMKGDQSLICLMQIDRLIRLRDNLLKRFIALLELICLLCFYRPVPVKLKIFILLKCFFRDQRIYTYKKVNSEQIMSYFWPFYVLVLSYWMYYTNKNPPAR